MKKFIKCLLVSLLVVGVLGALSGYAENLNKKALPVSENGSQQTLVVYQAPITRHTLFH